MEPKLSYPQQHALELLKDGKWHVGWKMLVKGPTLTSLVNLGLVESRIPSHIKNMYFRYKTDLEYRIKPRG